MEKSQLLIRLRARYLQWEALLDEIDPARMDQPGANGEWSMKDLVAHLTGWHRRQLDTLGAAQRGEPEPDPHWPAHLQTEDEINSWIYESNHGRSVPEVLDEMRQVFQELFAVIEGLPDDVRIEKIEPEFYLVWVNDKRYLPGEFFDHFHDDHEPNVRAWLERGEKP
jgi:hypothetical protein